IAITAGPEEMTNSHGSEPGGVRIWDAVKGKEIRTLRGSQGWIRAIALSPDVSVVAGAEWGPTIRFWSTANGEERLRITLPSRNQDYRGDWPLVFTPDGKSLISGSADNMNNTLYLWDTSTGKELRQIKHPASRLAVSPDGRMLAPTSRDGILHLWDLSTGQELRRIEKAGNCMAFSPDGRSLATGDGFGAIHLWEVATAGERRSLLGHESGRDSDG